VVNLGTHNTEHFPTNTHNTEVRTSSPSCTNDTLIAAPCATAGSASASWNMRRGEIRTMTIRITKYDKMLDDKADDPMEAASASTTPTAAITE
jgi:hypothetical protein